MKAFIISLEILARLLAVNCMTREASVLQEQESFRIREKCTWFFIIIVQNFVWWLWNGFLVPFFGSISLVFFLIGLSAFIVSALFVFPFRWLVQKVASWNKNNPEEKQVKRKENTRIFC